MQEELNTIASDPSLTPQNASTRGFTFIGDVIYEMNSFFVQDIARLIQQYGYKLGAPSHIEEVSSFLGLYAPLGSEKAID